MCVEKETRCPLENRVRLQFIQRHPFEGRNVGGMEVNEGGDSGVKGFFPARDAQAPTVSRFQARKAGARGGRYQIVAARLGKLEEFVAHDGADEVQTGIVFAGVAAAIAEKSGQGIAPAFRERFAYHIVGGGSHGEPALKSGANLS